MTAPIMANPYKLGGKFVSKKKFFANATPAQKALLTAPKNNPYAFTAAQTPARGARPGAGGLPAMPPFNPNSPEAWMREAAKRAWDKFPERAASVGLRPPPYATATDQFGPMNDPVGGPTHETPAVGAERVMQYLLARFNPIRGFNPQRLANYIEQWNLGFVRWLSLAWETIRDRDDQIKAVVAKREFAVSQLDWHIEVDDENDPVATKHRDLLKSFYENASCCNVIDQNEQGGINLLFRQMMRAVGAKFAVHEIVWQPGENGEGLTANFRYVPLWFFENRTGQLRYLPYELALDGIPLDAGGWLVTTGDGLHVATCIAYVFKHLGIQDWARFVEKFGVPQVIAKTAAAYNSKEWNELVEAMQHFNSDGAMVVNKNTEIAPFEVGRAGDHPHEKFVDRMDRAIARLWRGGDLSTNSRGGSGGVGALPQLMQEDEITKADCVLLSEALNFYVDRYVIKYQAGDDRPKAKFVITPPENVDTKKEIAVAEFLIDHGIPVSAEQMRKKFDVEEPEEGAELAKPAMMKPQQDNPPQTSGEGADV